MNGPDTPKPVGTVDPVDADQLEAAYQAVLLHVPKMGQGDVFPDINRILDDIASALGSPSSNEVIMAFKRASALYELISELEVNRELLPLGARSFSRDDLPVGVFVIAANTPITEYDLGGALVASYDLDHFDDAIVELLIT